MSSQSDWSDLPWRNNEIVAFYGTINNQTVHSYFMNSPFFDPTSNNGALRTQAIYQPNLNSILFNRHQLEARLRTMSGIEYMVVEEPLDGKEAENPVWVIRKQERRKKPQGQEDELLVLATYFVVGENIWQAHSIESILRSNLVSITSALTSFFSLASSLPLYSPIMGHHYLSPSAASSAKKLTGTASRAQSEAPSPPQSNPLAQAPTTATGVNGAKASKDTNTDTLDELRLLGESLRLAGHYGFEYTDENPLHGEPGNFVFASTTEHVKAQQQAQQAKAAAAAAAAASTASNRSSNAPTPLPEIKTQGLDQLKKASSKGGEKSPVSAGMPKLKRKKTGKGNIASPSSASPV